MYLSVSSVISKGVSLSGEAASLIDPHRGWRGTRGQVSKKRETRDTSLPSEILFFVVLQGKDTRYGIRKKVPCYEINRVLAKRQT